MNQSATLRAAGFASLLSIAGETLAFNPCDGTAIYNVTGVINRDVVKGKDFLRMFSAAPAIFELTGLTVIELQLSSFSSPPPVGGNFVDSTNYRHRIRLVIKTDVSYVCFCTPTLKS